MKLYLILVFSLLTCASLDAQTELSLRQCLDIASQQNLEIKQSAATMQIAENGVKQSRLQLLPNLNGGANYYINFGKSFDPVTYNPITQTTQSNSLSLSSSWSLYAGGIVANTIKKSETDLEVSRLENESLIKNVQLNVIVAYLTVLFSEEQLKSTQNQKQIALAQLDNSKKMADAGIIPEGNLLSLQAAVANNELNSIKAQNEVDKAYLNLKVLLQMNPTDNIKIVYPPITALEQIIAAPVADENTVMTYAEQTQPSIKKYDYQLQSNALAIKIAKGTALPSLSAIGSLSTNYSDATFPPFVIEADPYKTQLNDNLGEVVGLSLNIPLFNNGQVLINKQNAQVQYLNTELQQQTAINALRQTIAGAVYDLQAAHASYTAALTNYDASQKAFEFTEIKFNAGSASSLDYTTAINTLGQAETVLIQAKYDLIFKSKIIDYYLDKPLDF